MSDTGKALPPANRLVVCLDGTWNTADRKVSRTNITRIRDAVALEDDAAVREGRAQKPIPQRVYYDEGVGTGKGLDRIWGGAFGSGLSRNVRQAYKWLSENYVRPGPGHSGSEILVFGFSRGAFSVRSLCGYIAAAGLLRRECCSAENETAAWDHYRTFKKDRCPAETVRLSPLCHRDVRVAVAGVFDTVGALGIPVEYLRWLQRRDTSFHDTRPSKIILNAFHALALDELRGPFEAALWETPFNAEPERVEQVWFAGAHTDIGGGYADGRLATIPLDWMIRRVLTVSRIAFRPDALADILLDEDIRRDHACRGPVHDSRSLPYFWSRVRPRYRFLGAQPIPQRLGPRKSLPERDYDPLNEAVHVSVLERLQHEGPGRYRPVPLCVAVDLVAKGAVRVVGYDGNFLGARQLRPYAQALRAARRAYATSAETIELPAPDPALLPDGGAKA